MTHIATPKQNAVIRALLDSDTITAASELSGVSRGTIYRYMENPEFKAELAKERGRLLDSAGRTLQRASQYAAASLSLMVQGKEPSNQNKISACRCVLDKALAYTDTLDIITRLDALEKTNEQ